MDILFKFRKRIVKWVTISSPLLALFAIYFLNFHPLNYFKDILNPKFFENITTEKTEVIINQAIITLLINVLMELFRYFGTFSIKALNNDRRNTTYLPIGTTQKLKKVFFEVKFDYRNRLFKYIFTKLGGLNLFIWIPHWITIKLENEGNFPDSTIDKSNIKFISVSLEKAIGDKEVEGNIYINAVVLSGAVSLIEGNIITEIRPATTNAFFKALCFLLIFLCFELEDNKHKVISSRG
ncbi:hypothetical protein [Bacillus sp. T3]|uniref:hypothetical protein n=1 Tax=Bacillus sp. T3 TaxID=467262 RepID=UPI00298293B9|nr:hypothetical protein [Bacillus sp. T3]